MRRWNRQSSLTRTNALSLAKDDGIAWYVPGGFTAAWIADAADLHRRLAAASPRRTSNCSWVTPGSTSTRVPPSVALDVGRTPEETYALIEANSPWSSGIYGCDPDAVLTAVLVSNDPGPASDDEWLWRPDPALSAPAH